MAAPGGSASSPDSRAEPMGRLLLVCRLAARDLRRRPAEAALLLLAITAATTTLTLGLGLREATSKPYETTRAATAGPDVVASVSSPPDSGVPAALAGLKALANDPGVVGHSGPYPVAWTKLEAHGHTLDARVEGRDTAPAAIDQPELTQGSWLGEGGVVVEAAFADALGVGAGDRITPDRVLVAGLGVVEDQRRRGEPLDRGGAARALGGGAHLEHPVPHHRAHVELVVV